MTSIPLLQLRLEGPMQSWGIKSRWNYRDTATEPTKSGVVGLIACAIGYKRGDQRIEMELDKNLKIGVRVEQPGKIEVDFHTVSGDHTIATGKIKKNFTELSYRSYIEDGSFLVLISGNKNLLLDIEKALNNPKWPIYLGRKSCPPTRPVFDKITEDYDSIEDALKKIPWSCEYHEGIIPKRLRCIVEDTNGDKYRNDAILTNPARMYGIRRVKEIWVETPIQSTEVLN